MEVHPTAGTLADIYREEGSNPATALGFSLGTTSDPEHFQLSLFSLHVTTRQPDIRTRYLGKLGIRPPGPPPPTSYVARYLVIQDATEGTNRSIYVREGIYETNYTLEMDDVNQDDPHWRQKVAGSIKERRPNAMSIQFGFDPQPRIYFWVPAAMAERSRAAEQEHIDDLRRAYSLTLGTLIAALNGAAGNAASDVLAQQAATTACINALPVEVRGLATNTASWGVRYLALCAKSAGRDAAGDHSFSLELVGAEVVPALTVTYLTGAQREENGRLYVKVTTGTTRIPGTRTDDLIVY
jgi:hypothetical protein